MISIHNLQFAYSDNEVIFNDFNLEIETGSLFGLIGPNGAGKSTLISLITGLSAAQSGSIKIDGKELSSARDELLANLSSVPQEYAFYPKLTVQQNLNFFCRLYKNIQQPEMNINKAIKLTGLMDYQHRAAGKLSGGLKRRLNLAIGLLNKPALLILDEPTVGIDPQSRHFILAAIKQLNQEGTTILYTSHYMEEIEGLCDTIAVIDHGKILLSGELNKLLSSRTDTNNFHIQTQRAIRKNEIEVCDFYEKLNIHNNKIDGELDTSEQLTELLALLQKSGHKIEQVDFGKQSLESMYFALTDRAVRE
ncbi:MAG: ABC transporter ATP-binding protein [Gammaproteobacteria bacterium]|nr:ABC transporter ATP-binding protein [Gammaproteobacteria bacterium]